MIDTQDILTVEDCAAILHIAPKSVYRLIKEKKIKAIKILSVWRILRADLENFVTQ